MSKKLIELRMNYKVFWECKMAFLYLNKGIKS